MRGLQLLERRSELYRRSIPTWRIETWELLGGTRQRCIGRELGFASGRRRRVVGFMRSNTTLGRRNQFGLSFNRSTAWCSMAMAFLEWLSRDWITYDGTGLGWRTFFYGSLALSGVQDQRESYHLNPMKRLNFTNYDFPPYILAAPCA